MAECQGIGTTPHNVDERGQTASFIADLTPVREIFISCLMGDLRAGLGQNQEVSK